MHRTEDTLAAAQREAQAGRFPEAESLLRQVLTKHPSDPRALHVLGTLLIQTNRPDEATSVLYAASRADPTRPEPRNALALALRRARRHPEAIQVLEEGLRHNATSPELHANLAAALDESGRVDDAIAAYRRSLNLRPGHAGTHNNLGRLLARKGDWPAAITEYQTAISHNPSIPQPFNNLGNALRRVRRYGEAEVALKRAISLAPNYAEAYSNLGVVYKDLARYDQAEAAYRRALALMPNAAEVYSNLGIVLAEQNRYDEARDAYETALKLRPDLPHTFNNLGMLYRKAGRMTDAVAVLTRAVAVDPNYAEATMNLASALHVVGRTAEAMPLYEKLITENPDNAPAWSNLLLSLNYMENVGAVEVADRHRDFGRRFDRDDGATFTNDRDPNRPLRVAYLSPDLRRHSVAAFVEPVLARHDRANVQVFCYADVKHPDDVTARLRTLADEWRETHPLSDPELADLARRDGIDILVELAGHTEANRLPLLGRRIAPVQVSYLGYPNTTGLKSIDYRLTDAIADPPGQTDDLHTERLVRLPGCFLCYRPPDDAPPVAGSPASTRGHVTFGSFNNSTKITPATVALWARALAAVPTARMVIKSIFLGDDATRRNLASQFARHNIPPHRLTILPGDPDPIAHLNRYADIDIALDTFPYAGTTTTCESLWMGVPVITLAGQTHVSRVGASLLTATGLRELIARSPEEYVKMALALSSDIPRLARLRHTLRDAVATSPLTDRSTFLPALESAYRTMWTNWCTTTAQGAIRR